MTNTQAAPAYVQAVLGLCDTVIHSSDQRELRDLARELRPKIEAAMLATPVAGNATQDDVRDARRYRWLRDKSQPGLCTFYLSVGQAFKNVNFARETVDQAIDAAISRKAAA